MTTLRQLAEAAQRQPWEPVGYSPPIACINAFRDASTPAAILALLDDLDLTNEMNAQLREQNTSLDKACAELEAANDAFAKRQEWWNNRMFELEATIDAQRKLLERAETVLSASYGDFYDEIFEVVVLNEITAHLEAQHG